MSMMKIGTNKQIEKKSDKAIMLNIGTTFVGDPISTWYPKSVVKVIPTFDGYDIYVPEEMNLERKCRIGDFTHGDRVVVMLPLEAVLR